MRLKYRRLATIEGGTIRGVRSEHSKKFLCYERLGEFCCSVQIAVCIRVDCILCYILGLLKTRL